MARRSSMAGGRARGGTRFPHAEAERAGFEPATHLSARTRFPVALLRPLGHLSGDQAEYRREKWCFPRSAQTEGEGFEPSIRLTTDNGFRDRRIRPLCHPSARSTIVAHPDL